MKAHSRFGLVEVDATRLDQALKAFVVVVVVAVVTNVEYRTGIKVQVLKKRSNEAKKLITRRSC